MDQPVSAKKNRKYHRPQSPGTPIRQNATHCFLPRPQKNDAVSHPTHKQMARLVSYMCPPRFTPAIISTMEQLVQNSRVGNDCRISDVPKIGKTPISWIQEAIPTEMGATCITEGTSFDVLDCHSYAVLIECVLNRIKKGKQFCIKKESDMGETVPLLKFAYDEGHDNQWTTVILVLPHSSTFYAAHQGGAINNQEKGFTGMPLSWLRIHRRQGQPAAGAFIKEIKRCFYVSMGKRQVANLPCYQFNDYEPGSPLFPPDLFDGVKVLHPSQRRKQYNDRVKFAESKGSFRYGCRRYISGAHHQTIDPSVLRLDHRSIGNFQLPVTVRDSQG